MKEIQLTQGMVALVDNADFDWLNQWKWQSDKACRTYYASRKSNEGKKIYMHRLILGINSKGVCADHIDSHGLNNQRANLRRATHQQNMAHRRIPKNNTSGFKGVSWHKQDKRWFASIRVHGTLKNLGLFRCPTKAAKAYDRAALKYFGEFAYTNFEQGE